MQWGIGAYRFIRLRKEPGSSQDLGNNPAIELPCRLSILSCGKLVVDPHREGSMPVRILFCMSLYPYHTFSSNPKAIEISS